MIFSNLLLKAFRPHNERLDSIKSFLVALKVIFRSFSALVLKWTATQNCHGVCAILTLTVKQRTRAEYKKTLSVKSPRQNGGKTGMSIFFSRLTVEQKRLTVGTQDYK